ncbi:hypothetical protein NBRC116583_00870 [Arenicella sp. 4NH20-0111]|uniref:hypothetical protein n=1 Tax=Arenicella sp. 4NH20-0111 TaxID=3127648 RepID=UPI003101BACB
MPALFRHSLFKAIALIFVLFYLALIAVASYRYGSLIVNPKVAWYAANMQLIEHEQTEEARALELGPSIAKSAAILDSAAAVIEPVIDYDAKDRLTDEKIREAEEALKQMVALEEGYAPSKMTDVPASAIPKLSDVAVNQLALAKESEEKGAELFDQLAADPESIPTEQQINDLLAKGSQKQSNQGAIPAPVLQRVEESTGITPEEINELLDQ